MPKYLDEAGLTRFYENIRSQFGDEHLGVLVLGDSYGEGYTPDGTVTSWIDYFKAQVERFGYTVYSSALGGAGFYREDATKKFSTLASNLIATLTTAQKESIGAVIVGGGYNDRTNTRANIYDGMVSLRQVITANLPNVRRVLILPFGMAVQGLTTDDHASFQYSTIVDMVLNYIDANAEAQLGSVYGNANMILRRNVYFSSDGVHPKQNGQYAIGCYVRDMFLGNSNSLIAKKFNNGYTPNFANDSSINVVGMFKVYTNEDMLKLCVDAYQQINVTFSAPSNLTCDSTHPVNICWFTDAAIQKYGNIRIPVSATVRSTTSTPQRYQQIQGEIQIINGVMKFNAAATSANGSNYLTIESVDRISMLPLSMALVDGLYLA